MPYIGNIPAEKYASYDVQHITTSATTSYALDKNVANENEIRVVLNNIIQQPGASYAYTASANTLTLSVATTSSDTLYVVFTGKAVQTVTPPPSSVGLAQLNATGSPGTNTFLRGDNSWATPSDTSLTLNNNAANRIVAGTGTTNTMDAQANLIFSDGKNLGVGTTAPNSFSGYSTVTIGGANSTTGSGLDFENNSGTILARIFGDASGVQYGAVANGFHRFEIDGSEKMRIHPSGIVGIGAGNQTADLGVGLHIKTSDAGAPSGGLNTDADDLVIENSGSGGMTIYTGTQNTGAINFSRSSGVNGGVIRYDHNNETMDFFTENAERAAINNIGQFLIGTGATFGDANSRFYVNQSVANKNTMSISVSQNGLNGLCFFNASHSRVGTVAINSGSVTYNTTSDYRLKEAVDYNWDATSRLKQLKPARFNFIADETNTLVDGFIAHEVSSIVPEAITGEKDAMIPESLYTKQVLYDDNDVLPEGKNIGDVKHSIGDVEHAETIDPQGIDQGKLVPLLVKSLQEALAEIDTLKTKVEALENA